MLRSTVCGSPPGEDGIRPRRHWDGLGSLKASEYCRLACGAAANELLLKILAKYEDRIADAPLGSEFQECYDPRRAAPTPEYLDLYARVKEDLAATGLEFPY